MSTTIKPPPLNGRKLMGFATADDDTYVVVVLWREDENDPEYCVARVSSLEDPTWWNGVYVKRELNVAYRWMTDRAGVALLR